MDYEKITVIYQDMLNASVSDDPVSNCREIASRLGNYIEENLRTDKNDLSELALNYWRLLNWVEKSNADKKSIANSALKRINMYLEKQQIELRDLSGQRYDDGFAADVLGIETETDTPEEDLIVSEMVKPIIIYRGSVIKHGQVILGDELVDNDKTRLEKTEISEATIINEHADSAKDTTLKIERKKSFIEIVTGSVRRLLHRRDKNEKVL